MARRGTAGSTEYRLVLCDSPLDLGQDLGRRLQGYIRLANWPADHETAGARRDSSGWRDDTLLVAVISSCVVW